MLSSVGVMMTGKRKSRVTSVGMTMQTRDTMTRMTLDYGARLGRRVSMAALSGAMLTVAQAHEDELLQALGQGEGASDE
jgi:hypothetical protein